MLVRRYNVLFHDANVHKYHHKRLMNNRWFTVLSRQSLSFASLTIFPVVFIHFYWFCLFFTWFLLFLHGWADEKKTKLTFASCPTIGSRIRSTRSVHWFQRKKGKFEINLNERQVFISFLIIFDKEKHCAFSLVHTTLYLCRKYIRKKNRFFLKD